MTSFFQNCYILCVYVICIFLNTKYNLFSPYNAIFSYNVICVYMFFISCWITNCVLFCSQLSRWPAVFCLGLSPVRFPPLHIIMSVGVILVHLMFGQPCWWDFMSVPSLKIRWTSSNHSTRQEKPSYKLVRVVQEPLEPLSAVAIARGCCAGWEGKPLLLKTPWFRHKSERLPSWKGPKSLLPED